MEQSLINKILPLKKTSACMLALMLSLGASHQASAVDISISIENLSSQDGLFLTPLWVSFHDGSFDTFSNGSGASAGLQQLAEDGDTSGLSAQFSSSSAGMNGGVDGTILGPAGFTGAPIIDPGETTSAIFNLNAMNNRYFSYASMVIPSNDAFIGNDDQLGHAIFDSAGNYNGDQSFIILGSNVYDAGTEINNEMDAAFLNQMAANTGLDENGVVHAHNGYLNSFGNPAGIANILGGTNGAGFFFDPANADFSLPGFQVARLTISHVPEPGTFMMMGLGIVGLGLARNKQKTN